MKSNKSIIAFVCVATIIVMVLSMVGVEALRGHALAVLDGRENQLLRNIFSTISSFMKSLPRYLIDFIVFIFNAIIGGFFFFVSSITRTMTTAPTSTSPPTALSTMASSAMTSEMPTALSTSSAMTSETTTVSAIFGTTSMLTGPSSVASTTATPVETTSSEIPTSSATAASSTTPSMPATAASSTSTASTGSTTASTGTSTSSSSTTSTGSTSSTTTTTSTSTSTSATTAAITTSPLSPSSKLVFITSMFFDGNLGGIEGADAKCGSLAMAEGLAGTFFAWLSNDTVSPSTRFVNNSCPYVRRDNETVASSFQSLLDNGPNISISITEQGDGVLSNQALVWSNTQNLGGMRVGNNDCNDWTSNSMALAPHLGNSLDLLAWSDFASILECQRAFRLYCFQQ